MSVSWCRQQTPHPPPPWLRLRGCLELQAPTSRSQRPQQETENTHLLGSSGDSPPPDAPRRWCAETRTLNSSQARAATDPSWALQYLVAAGPGKHNRDKACSGLFFLHRPQPGSPEAGREPGSRPLFPLFTKDWQPFFPPRSARDSNSALLPWLHAAPFPSRPFSEFLFCAGGR